MAAVATKDPRRQEIGEGGGPDSAADKALSALAHAVNPRRLDVAQALEALGRVRSSGQPAAISKANDIFWRSTINSKDLAVASVGVQDMAAQYERSNRVDVPFGRLLGTLQSLAACFEHFGIVERRLAEFRLQNEAVSELSEKAGELLKKVDPVRYFQSEGVIIYRF